MPLNNQTNGLIFFFGFNPLIHLYEIICIQSDWRGKNLNKQLHKKWKYECTMNEIPEPRSTK